ncbi:MAG TPA: hypothetical protein PK590_05040 [Candidatus Omnitrophota bacterium]|nr:hypothetical protein [Candidatus Omnitrophota bacterium]
MRTKFAWAFLLTLVLIAWAHKQTIASEHEDWLIADFDSQAKTNNAGGGFFTSSKRAVDSISMSFAEGDALNNPAGHSMRINYSIADTDDPFAFFAVDSAPTTMVLSDEKPKFINFFIKAPKGSPYHFRAVVFGKNEFGRLTFVERKNIGGTGSDTWTVFSVPLKRGPYATSGEAFSCKIELQILFDYIGIRKNALAGTFFIDQITLSDRNLEKEAAEVRKQADEARKAEKLEKHRKADQEKKKTKQIASLTEEAENAQRDAEKAQRKAEKAQRKADGTQQDAEMSRKQAAKWFVSEEVKRKAEIFSKKAEEAKLKAEEAQQEAEKAKQYADMMAKRVAAFKAEQ